MLFGVRLENELYAPWKNHYIAYDSLKKLLKEEPVLSKKQENWSETDETAFVSVLDSELEKVYSFQTKTYEELSHRISKIEKSIDASFNVQEAGTVNNELEDILGLAQELDRFSRLNFTGFTKIVKKHDRVHSQYQVKPLLQVRLNALPFHSEDYSPLLYRLSSLYAFLGDNFGTSSTPAGLSSVVGEDNADYTTYKFWVHPENVMEVKTRILRHLPLLVYGSNKPSGSNNDDEQQPSDPTITSLYFDNPSLELYDAKLQKNEISPSLRLRWFGKLADKPTITLEKKVVDHTFTGEFIPDEKFDIKEKYIQRFIEGSYSMEKSIKKMKERGTPQSKLDSYKKSVDDIQSFISEHELSPVMRATYTRTAFQIPGDNRVRAILDSDILFIREDSFDSTRPIRDPDNWHKTDIDSKGLENVLSVLRKGEFAKFPFAVLEFRVFSKSSSISKGQTPGSVVDGHTIVPAIKRHGKWIDELTNSHLVKEVPKFSKFVQGIASLFAEDDRLDALPFWINELESDIRQDPKQAWEEQKRRIQQAASTPSESTNIRLRTASGSRISEIPKIEVTLSGGEPSSAAAIDVVQEVENDDVFSDMDYDSTDDGEMEDDTSSQYLGKHKASSLRRRIKNLNLPFLKNRGPRLDMDSEDEVIILPPGLAKPDTLIRTSGPVKVETKVWLANERTFNKWLHITTLLSALTFTLYSSVSKASSETTAVLVAYILFGLTIFSGLWGYITYMQRLKYIRQRSEQHLDNPIGPIIISVGLLAALIINFCSNYKLHFDSGNPIGTSINN